MKRNLFSFEIKPFQNHSNTLKQFRNDFKPIQIKQTIVNTDVSQLFQIHFNSAQHRKQREQDQQGSASTTSEWHRLAAMSKARMDKPICGGTAVHGQNE